MNQIIKSNKKVLAVLLALTMLITVLPVSVFADENEEENENAERCITYDGNGGYVSVDYTDPENPVYRETETRWYGNDEWFPMEDTINPTYPDATKGFLGWATKKNADMPDIEYGMTLIEEIPDTIYAVWGNYRIITCYANGGFFGEADSTYEETILDGEIFSSLETPQNANSTKAFAGWATSPTAAKPDIIPGDTYTKDIPGKVYAVWGDAVNVTFDANGGYYGDGSTSRVETYVKGSKLGEPWTPENDSVPFEGWYDKKKGGNEVTWDTELVTDLTLYARWADYVEDVSVFDTFNRKYTLLADPEEELTLSVKVKANNTEGMQFQWSKYEVQSIETGGVDPLVEGQYNEIPGETGKTLIVVPTKNERYMCEVKDIYGNEEAVFIDVILKSNIKTIDYTSEKTDSLTLEQPLKMYRIIPSTRIKYRNPIKQDPNTGDVMKVTVFDKYMKTLACWEGEKQPDSEVILEKGGIYYLKIDSPYFNAFGEESPYVIEPTAEFEPDELVYGKNLFQGDENDEQVFCFTAPETGIYDIHTEDAWQMVLSDSQGNELVTADFLPDEDENGNPLREGVSIQQEIKKGERVKLTVKGIMTSEPYLEFSKFNDFYMEDAMTYADVYVDPGASIKLEPVLHAIDKSQVEYQWSWYDYENDCSVDIEGATNSYLELENINYEKEYTCFAHDQYGNATSKGFRVYVDNDLQIGYDPNQDEPETPTVLSASSKQSSWIGLKAKTVTYNGKKQAIGKATVKGSTGKVSYFYYKDKACKKKTTPRKAGVYYVIAKVAADSKYNGAVSKKVKLTIKKKRQKVTMPKKSQKKMTGHISVADKAFLLGAKTNGDGKLVFKSSNKNAVTVSKKGSIKIVGNGKATITVYAKATKNSLKSKAKKYSIKVYPYTLEKKDGRIKIAIKDKSFIMNKYHMLVEVNGVARRDKNTSNTIRTLADETATISNLKKGDKVVISIKKTNEKEFLTETIVY